MTKKVLGADSQSIALTRKVDPDLVSGFEVAFGNYQLDLSGRTHIAKAVAEIVESLVAESSAVEQAVRKATKPGH